MKARTFLDGFATIADAPGGVERLRGLVLRFAVSGRLVDQDPSDEPANAVLERIAEHREMAMNELSLRKYVSATDEALKNSPSTVPPGWAKARLGGTFLLVMGNSPPGDSYNERGDGVPLINGPVEFTAGALGRTVLRQYTTAPTRLCKEGDLLVCVRGATTGRTNIAGFDACIGRGVALVRGWEVQAFLNLVMWDLGSQLLAAGKGTTFPSISQDDLADIRVLIPPLDEQKRIVARVNELLGLCDELEALQARRRSATTRFRGSALQALVDAETPDAISSAWDRVGANWPTITDNLDSITEFRETVIHLAVRGRLTTRTPADGSAETILQSALAEALDQPQLVDSDGVKLPVPYDIPATWRWVVLGGVTADILAGWSAPSTQEMRSGEEWAVLKVSACSWGEFRPQENKALQPGTVPKEELEVRPGDFLISRANTSGLVARSVVVEATPPRLMLSDKTLRITPVDGCNSRYLNLANLAPHARAHYSAEATGTSDSMKNVSQRAIRRTPIPLPPSAEQDRIVATVDRLNRLCDNLQLALQRRSDIASHLSESITTQAASCERHLQAEVQAWRLDGETSSEAAV